MVAADEKRKIEAETLYGQYGKPLEAGHRGEYVAITNDGKTILGVTVLEVMRKASAAFGPGSYIFKVGDRSVGKWR